MEIREAEDGPSSETCHRILFNLSNKDYALDVDNNNSTVTAVEVGYESRFLSCIFFTRHIEINKNAGVRAKEMLI